MGSNQKVDPKEMIDTARKFMAGLNMRPARLEDLGPNKGMTLVDVRTLYEHGKPPTRIGDAGTKVIVLRQGYLRNRDGSYPTIHFDLTEGDRFVEDFRTLKTFLLDEYSPLEIASHIERVFVKNED